MKLKAKIALLIIVSATLQGCGAGGMNKQSGGTLIGGATGALLGAQFGKGSGALFATGIGALAGALIGGQIGAQMDENDRRLAELTSQKALETARTGQSVGWNNPDNGHTGTVTPTKTYQNTHGQYCREYTQKVVIGGKTQDAYGRACRKPDGQWEVVN